ncbi:acetylglutamate kinase [Paraferrimonas haliotis]|uniref:Acetylglutamate kinase n=1 Tax=Paraferrimonas haliotis TaxID=2013866 RepID=A0AA37WYA4_9GAMM|nr:acetylglutamate kinase [Paraferrimonas haliotis]GLS83540.1 acetylglutamate kinase [Paraferrimonas haliotis]
MKKTLVIKVGGALLADASLTSQLMDTIATLMQSTNVVLVHGGGDLVDEQLAANGYSSDKHFGLRISPASHMPVVVGALAGTANKTLQAAATAAGINNIAISLADANLVNASIKDPMLGCVGEVTGNDASLLEVAFNKGWLTIISSIAVDKSGTLLNINADQAASAVASLVNGQLILLSNVAGVLGKNGQLLDVLDTKLANQLIDEQVIKDGMLVKVKAAQQLAEQIGSAVIVGSWSEPQALLKFVQGSHFGTQVLGDAKEPC